MKKEHILYTLTIFLFSFSLSCKKQVTATVQDIDFIPKNDTIYTQALEALYSDPLSSRRILKEAMDTRLAHDSLGWYMLYNLYVKTYLTASELDSIIPLCRKVEQFCSQQKKLTPYHYYLLTDMNNNIGNRYALTSMNDSALKYFKLVFDYSQQTHNGRIMLTAHTNLANVYVLDSRYDQGAYYYRRALYIADSLNIPKQELITVYTGLGQTYTELRNFELAHHYYNLAYDFFDQMDINRKFVYFNTHGNVYYFERKYPEALELFKKGYELENEYTRSICMVNMGEIYMLTGLFDSAQIYLDQSQTYFKAIRNTSVLYHIQTLVFELNLRKGNLAEATKQLDAMTDNLYAEPTLVGIRKKYLQHYYEEIGDYRKANQYLKENIRMDDSIRNDRIRMRVAETDLRYKQDTTLMKQKLFIQQQQNDMKSLELSVFIWILICTILLIVTLFIYFYQKKQRAYLLAETRNKIISLRMENIRNRVSPHFIFNTLNRAISHYKESDNRYKELYHLIKIMRLNLRLTEKLCITLAEEIDFVRTYLAIEQERFGSSLQINIWIDPQIDADDFELPSMMIQIPVENAIKHGLQQKEGEKQLSVTVCRQNGYTIISVKDNGAGFRIQAGSPDMQSTGTGLKVLNQTIQLLNARNSTPITVLIRKSEQGTNENPGCLVQFTLPEDYSYALPEGM